MPPRRRDPAAGKAIAIASGDPFHGAPGSRRIVRARRRAAQQMCSVCLPASDPPVASRRALPRGDRSAVGLAGYGAHAVRDPPPHADRARWPPFSFRHRCGRRRRCWTAASRGRPAGWRASGHWRPAEPGRATLPGRLAEARDSLQALEDRLETGAQPTLIEGNELHNRIRPAPCAGQPQTLRAETSGGNHRIHGADVNPGIVAGSGVPKRPRGRARPSARRPDGRIGTRSLPVAAGAFLSPLQTASRGTLPHP